MYIDYIRVYMYLLYSHYISRGWFTPIIKHCSKSIRPTQESLPSLRSLRLRRTMTEGYAGAFKACLRLETWIPMKSLGNFPLNG